MKVRTAQAAFVRGELGPSVYGRTDKNWYQYCAARLRNVYVTPQGGCPVREGCKYIDNTWENQDGRLLSFEFNNEQTYLFCFTPGRLRIYQNDAFVVDLSSAPIGNLTLQQIREMNWTQSADTLILVHPDVRPIRITRTGATTFSQTTANFNNIPQLDFGSGPEAVISPTRGWPASIAFKYGRLWLGGLKSRPQTLLASKVGDFFNLNKGTGADDDGIDITIDDDRVNAIRNLFPGRSLQIFTTGGEFSIETTAGDPVTPAKIPEQLRKATLHGCNRARPVSVDGATIFVESGGYVVRQFAYNDLEQSYNALNISQLSPHLIRNPTRMDVRRATQSLPADYVYTVNEDGTMGVLNVIRDEDLLAWSLFETDGTFEDVAVVGRDVYVITRRIINGSPVRFVEKFDPTHRLDASEKATSVSPKTSWSGFSHLSGETVKVLGDGYVLQDAAVSSGNITSSESVSAVEVGLNYTPLIETLPVDLVVGGQPTTGEFKRLAWANVRVLNTRGLVIQQKTGETYKPAYRQFGASVLDLPPETYTGWLKTYLGGFARDVQLVLTQEDPLEFNVLSLVLGVGV